MTGLQRCRQSIAMGARFERMKIGDPRHGRKARGFPAGRHKAPSTWERWSGVAAIIIVDLFVLALLSRALVSSFAGGPGAEQAFAAGVLAALVLVQSERR